MLIAQEKRKTNIAEYILYMWQIEDILRALKFDSELVEAQLVNRFQLDDNSRKEIFDWYKNLIVMMQKEQITEKGHVQFLNNLVNDLNEFHLALLQSGKDPRYGSLFQLANPVVAEFREKSKAEKDNDIQVSLQALQSLMLLGLQKKEISKETQQAVSHITKLIAHLAARYHKFEKGEFDLE